MDTTLPPLLSLERTGRSALDPDSRAIYLFLSLTWFLLPWLLSMAGLRLALDQFLMIGGICLLGLCFAWCLRQRGLAGIATLIEAHILLYLISLTGTVMTFIAATNHNPYADASLATVDRVMLPGLDWPRAMLAFSTSGLPVRLAEWIYNSIVWQPQILIGTLILLSQGRRVWHFMQSLIVSLCLVVPIFALYPARGGYDYFGIAENQVPAIHSHSLWHQPLLLDSLRHGTLGTISLGSLDGIVNYPSFHANAAVLLACAFWHIRLLRWPFLFLNLLMLASAIPMGGHYVIDLVAGGLAAGASLPITSWLMNLADKASAPPLAHGIMDDPAPCPA
jgi:membrane-associated phospholipid phosphatase